MNDEDLQRIIVDLLGEEGHGDGDVTSRTALTEGGLGLTSLELVRLLVSLEERLGIELDDALMMNASFDTVDDIVELVARSTEAEPARADAASAARADAASRAGW